MSTLFLAFHSCKKEEELLFDESASTRMNEAIAEAYKAVQSNENGWMMKYYPHKSQEYGGFTLFMNFISDSEVEISMPGESSVTSGYSVVPESGAILSFDTYNSLLHFFSEPGMDSGVGPDDSGIGGDFEFIVLEVTPELIKLKGKKTGNSIELVALGAGEMDNLLTEYDEAEESFSEFSSFEIEINGEVFDVSARYNAFTIIGAAGGQRLAYRILPNDELEFYKEYEVEGVEFDKMTFTQPTEGYPLGYFSEESGKVKIIPIPTPLNRWFVENTWGFAYSKIGPFGQQYWNLGKNNLSAAGYYVNAVSIGDYYDYDAMSYVLNDGAIQGGVTFVLQPVSGTTDEVLIDLDGSVLNLQGFSVAQWNAGLNALAFPVYGTFTISGVSGPDKPTEILLTDKENPDNTFQLVMERVLDPFDN